MMNDLTGYLETHFEVVKFIMSEISNSIINKVLDQFGTGGLYELAKDWTDEFEAKHKDTSWGEELDFFDTIEEFLKEKLKS